jgi:hypothetical protein
MQGLTVQSPYTPFVAPQRSCEIARPSEFDEVLGARHLVGKHHLKLAQRPGKVGHGNTPLRSFVRHMLRNAAQALCQHFVAGRLSGVQ